MFSPPQIHPLILTVLISLLWGYTNPLLNSHTSSSFSKTLKSPKAVLAYTANQCGSLLFYLLLSNSSLVYSMMVNSLTQVLTLFFSIVVFEERVNDVRYAVVGSMLVVFGVAVCLYSKQDQVGAVTF
jgi:uncharacterized membrane protein